MAKTKALPAPIAKHFIPKFERWLKERFGEKGWQTKAAEAIGVSQSTISGVLYGGKTPGIAVLLDISAAMGESLDSLLGRVQHSPGYIEDGSERYPAFARASAAARILGIREDAIQDVKGDLYDNPQNLKLDASHWFDRIRRTSELYERDGGASRPKKPPFKKQKREL